MEGRWACLQNKIHNSNSEILWWQHRGRGCFSAHGTGNISLIEGRMNAAAYQNILEAKLISVENLDFSLNGVSKKILTQITLQNLRKRVSRK